MKKDQVHVGHTYVAKVSDQLTRVRLEAVNPHGGWDAINLKTNKKVRIKSAQRLRQAVKDGAGPSAPSASKADADRGSLTLLDKEKRAAKPSAPREKKVSCLDAAATVLKAEGKPMNCGAMIEAMSSAKLWTTKAPTPAATLYSAILREIGNKGKDARFRKTERGHFALNVDGK